MDRHGFSLVELSIVLVILGLLTGGILTGQSLIRAAELRKIPLEKEMLATSFLTFKDRYFYLPGDMPNATDFWGSAGGNGTVGDGCESGAGTGTQTCNGNGDGAIYQINPAAPGGQYNERFMLFQHLANAGLIEGSYTGRAGSNTKTEFLPENAFYSKGISNASYEFNSIGYNSGNAANFAYYYGNRIMFGSVRENGGPWDAVLTPEESWNIDKKIDDGLPASGNLIGVYWNNLCSIANDGSPAKDDYDASYNLSEGTVQCALIFPEAY